MNVDNITIDGTEIDLSSGDLTVDVAGDIILDADGGDVFLKDGGTTFGEFTNSSTDFVIKSTTSDKDIIFKGNDGGSAITALTLDMSEAGNASFNASVTTGAELTVGTLFKMPDNTSGKILVGDGTSYQEVALSGDATLASNGAITLSSSAVENSMLAGSISDDKLATISTAGKVDIGALEIDGATDINADLADADLIIVDDGANGTERKSTFTRVKKLIYTGLSSDLTASASGAVTIANGAITTGKIGADAVDGTKIADDSIDSEHIVDGSVDTAHIADANVTTAKLADNAVTTAKITDANITTAKINDSAVTNAKLAGSIADTKLNTITTAGKVDIGALEIDGATDIGADIVDADLLIVDDGANGTERKSTFTRVKKYIHSSVSGDATVSDSGALTIANDAVEQSMIADDAVGADQLASNAVVTASIVDDNVTTAKIADLNVTTAKIANNAVTAGK